MSDAPKTDGYCFGCDRAVLHCLCHLAGIGGDDEPRVDPPLTNAQLLADPRVKALVDALENMVGAFDNPISRRKLSSDVAAEARKEARAALAKLKETKNE